MLHNVFLSAQSGLMTAVTMKMIETLNFNVTDGSTCIQQSSVELTPPLLHHVHAGGEARIPGATQKGSSQRVALLHGRNGGHVGTPRRPKRLTKGVSISLPSSPLLPHQSDMVASQSCVRFAGGSHCLTHSCNESRMFARLFPD